MRPPLGWIKPLFSRARNRTPISKSPRTYRPQLETLEDRVVPTVAITPTVVVNGGPPAYTDCLGNSVSLSGQSSVVEQLQVTFNEPVTLDANAFAIINIGNAVEVD